MNKFFDLTKEIVQELSNDQFSVIYGGTGGGLDKIDNGNGCEMINNGPNCDLINQGSLCAVVNNTLLNCTLINQANNLPYCHITQIYVQKYKILNKRTN